MSFTLDQARAKLAEWLAAESAIATGGQSYSITTGTGSRALTRADLTEVRRQIKYWKDQVEALTPGRRRPARYAPR